MLASESDKQCSRDVLDKQRHREKKRHDAAVPKVGSGVLALPLLSQVLSSLHFFLGKRNLAQCATISVSHCLKNCD